jgi:hypothetical protein
MKEKDNLIEKLKPDHFMRKFVEVVCDEVTTKNKENNRFC